MQSQRASNVYTLLDTRLNGSVPSLPRLLCRYILFQNILKTALHRLTTTAPQTAIDSGSSRRQRFLKKNLKSTSHFKHGKTLVAKMISELKSLSRF